VIGVAVSTRQRPQVLAQALQAWAVFLPDVLVVNHDRDGRGVAVTKNAGIAALMDAGCEHLFLADDDVWPVTADWAAPYIASAVPHLQYLWDGTVREERDGWVARSRRHGVILYARRSVIERVGGMRTDWPSPFGYEHIEWSRRIYRAGLTPHPYIDVQGSTRLWHALDQEGHTSSTPDRRALAAANKPMLARYDGSCDFVDYREA
jgi:hypothetical protein